MFRYRHFLILLVLNSFILNLSFAQSQKQLLAKAEEKLKKGEFKESVKLFEKAFSVEEGTAYHYYRAAIASALAGDQDNAFDFLENSIEKGFKRIKIIREEKAFQPLYPDPKWQTLLIGLENSIKDYEKSFSKAQRRSLMEWQEEDQDSRKSWLEQEEQFGVNSPQADSLLLVTKALDRSHTDSLKKFIKKFGFPKRDSVGPEGVFTVFLISQHSSDLELQKITFNYLKEAAERKDIDPESFAVYADKLRQKEGKPQLYGTLIITNPKTRKKELYQIEDEENLEARRESMDLEPIEDFVKKAKINYQPKNN